VKCIIHPQSQDQLIEQEAEEEREAKDPKKYQSYLLHFLFFIRKIKYNNFFFHTFLIAIEEKKKSIYIEGYS